MSFSTTGSVAGQSLNASGNSNTIGNIFTTGGNVGINTTNPGSSLHVAGTIPASPVGNGVHIGIDPNTYSSIQLNSTAGSYIDFGTSGGDFQSRFQGYNSGDIYISTNGGANNRYVGINNASPAYSLDVSGTQRLFGANAYALTLDGNSGNTGLHITYNSSGNYFLDLGIAAFSGSYSSSAVLGDGVIRVNSGRNLILQSGTGGSNILITSSGNVGIGTTSPGTTLDVSGTGRFSNYLTIGTSNSATFVNQSICSNTNYPMYFCSNKGNLASFAFGNGDASQGYVFINENSATLNVGGTLLASGTVNTAWAPTCTFNNNSTSGNNGIGAFLTPNMPTKTYANTYFGKSLSAGNSVSIGYYYVGSNNDANSLVINHYGKGGGIYMLNNGNVGINTTNPVTNLHVHDGAGGGIKFTSSLSSTNFGIFSPQYNGNWSSDSVAGDTIFRTDYGAMRFVYGGNNAAMIIDTSNNVIVRNALSKGSGTFDIEHPLKNDPKERLCHSFIEGPRCDLIYRGSVNLINGTASVNIDSDCTFNSQGSMMQGTFQALCANPVYYLQNNDSFDRVRANINNNILTIICENTNSTDTIHWMVVAERKDSFVKQWNRTDSNGYLITEYTK